MERIGLVFILYSVIARLSLNVMFFWLLSQSDVKNFKVAVEENFERMEGSNSSLILLFVCNEELNNEIQPPLSQVGSSCNAPDFYSRGQEFEYRLRYGYSENIYAYNCKIYKPGKSD